MIYVLTSPTPPPSPSPSCCSSITVTAGEDEYSPGETVYVSISLTGTSCCFRIRKPSPVSLIAPTGETIVQKDLASLFSDSVCPGTKAVGDLSFLTKLSFLKNVLLVKLFFDQTFFFKESLLEQFPPIHYPIRVQNRKKLPPYHSKIPYSFHCRLYYPRIRSEPAIDT